MRKMITGAVAGAMLLAGRHAGASISLYDGTQAGLPQTQGWLAYQALLGTKPTLDGGTIGPTKLDTTAGGSNTEEAGFSNYNASALSYSLANASFPTLAPATGFDLTFNMKLDSESHSGSTDRAGFSVILLGTDDYGVELGFWAGQIWAQSATFTHTVEQESTLDPTSGFFQYDIHIQGSAYTLSENGHQILTGPTRYYGATDAFPPYITPNFVFLGDDTTSAQGIAEIQSVGIAVPEPASGVLLIGLAALSLRRQRQQNAPQNLVCGSSKV